MPYDVAMPTILLLDNLTFPTHSCNHQNNALPNICYIENMPILCWCIFCLSPLLSEYFIFSDLVITNVLLQAFSSFPSQCQTVAVCTFADFQPFAVFLICSVLKSLSASNFYIVLQLDRFNIWLYFRWKLTFISLAFWYRERRFDPEKQVRLYEHPAHKLSQSIQCPSQFCIMTVKSIATNKIQILFLNQLPLTNFKANSGFV